MIILDSEKDKIALEEMKKGIEGEMERKLRETTADMVSTIQDLTQYTLTLGAICSAYIYGIDFTEKEIDIQKQIVATIISNMGLEHVNDIPKALEMVAEAKKDHKLMQMEGIGGTQ